MLDYTFNRSLERIQLLSSVQGLMFDHALNQSLEGIQVPNSLQSLRFDSAFNQSVEGIHSYGAGFCADDAVFW